MSDSNFDNIDFGLGVQNNKIYLGHFENRTNKKVFIPDSNDMTQACLSIVSLLMNNKCKMDNTEVTAIAVNQLGTLHFWTKDFTNKFIEKQKSDEKQ